MAELGRFCVLLVSLVFLAFTCKSVVSASARVEVSTLPVQSITIGGMLGIKCQVWNFEETYTVNIFRTFSGQTEQLTRGSVIVPSSLGQRMFLSTKTMSDGSIVYFMTITDVSGLDQGEYWCKVYQLSGGNYIVIDEDSTQVEVYYLPDSIYPQCQSTPAIPNMNEHMPIKLTCLSANGVPTVSLRWVDTMKQEISSRTISQDGTVKSELYINTATSFHGSALFCEMTSPGFPDFQRTCRIDIIRMSETRPPTVPYHDITNPMWLLHTTSDSTTKLRSTEKQTAIVPTQADKQTLADERNALLSSICSGVRSEDDAPDDAHATVLYLSVATTAATTLFAVSLITAIIMCYMYRDKSRKYRKVQTQIITKQL